MSRDSIKKIISWWTSEGGDESLALIQETPFHMPEDGANFQVEPEHVPQKLNDTDQLVVEEFHRKNLLQVLVDRYENKYYPGKS